MNKVILALALTAGAVLMQAPSAQAAVVYCKYIGVPKGCVVKAGVVLKPAPVVYCKYVGVPKGCVVKPGVVLKPAPVVVRRSPVNRGGPVNRAGVR